MRPEASASRSNTTSWLVAVSLQRARQAIVPCGSYTTVSASLAGPPSGWKVPEIARLPLGSSVMSAARSSEPARPAQPPLPQQRAAGAELERRPVVALAVGEAGDVDVAAAVDRDRVHEIGVLARAVVALHPALRAVGAELDDEVVVVGVEDRAVVGPPRGVDVAGRVDRQRAHLAAGAGVRGPARRAVRAELHDRERGGAARLHGSPDVEVAGRVRRDRARAIVGAAVEAEQLRLLSRGRGGCREGDCDGVAIAAARMTTTPFCRGYRR